MSDFSKPIEKTVPAIDMLGYIEKELVDIRHRLGFRGQRCAAWKLSPSLARFLSRLKEKGQIDQSATYENVENRLKEEFKKNLLLNRDLTPDQLQNVDLWQYGQHFGLPTPLLDWTHSAYVGLFFALMGDSIVGEDGLVKPRCLWVMDLELLSIINTQIREEVWPRMKGRIEPEEYLKQQIPILEIVGEIDGYNRRIGYQQGFFTKHVYYESLEVWAARIALEVAHECLNYPFLRKITFSPDEQQRSKMLVILDKMNVNSRTLFPDIKGSVEQTCFAFEHPRPRGALWFSLSTRKR
ncbi:MAG: FRG domain-containing protein [Chlorobaculum sp.]|nr:FRG domain-containing protein [Chlorobaculum sp.]